jgi:hypothetical protein
LLSINRCLLVSVCVVTRQRWKVITLGGEAGPNLAGVAKRGDRRYLLESIVYSNAVVVSGYGIVSLDLINGANLVGTLVTRKARLR